jgi:ribosome assembly protein YihI (activator of Der GTPase)
LEEFPDYYDRLKKIESKEATGSGSAGGFEGPIAFKDSDFVRRSFDETPKKIEATEATGSGSAGSYETTAAWAKSSKKKDWRGASKTQIPGGKFVQVKKKCKKFPYCNQGDINALKIWENETLKKVIKNVSEKQNLSENVIKNIIAYELGLI